MNCEQARDLLPDHALGTLLEHEEAAVSRHLRGCGPCRAEAASMDAGIAMLASATHVVDPPPDLESRVLTTLRDEWSESPSPTILRRTLSLPRMLVAATVVVVAGLLAWAVTAQVVASRNAEDAGSYRSFLSTVGGRELRAGTLDATIEGLTGSVVVYDSHKNQSWVGIHVRTDRAFGPLHASIAAPDGRTIDFPFDLEVNETGRGSTWLDTPEDLTEFTTITLTDADGAVVASASVHPGDD
jgi:hypothetical protein